MERKQATSKYTVLVCDTCLHWNWKPEICYFSPKTSSRTTVDIYPCSKTGDSSELRFASFDSIFYLLKKSALWPVAFIIIVFLWTDDCHMTRMHMHDALIAPYYANCITLSFRHKGSLNFLTIKIKWVIWYRLRLPLLLSVVLLWGCMNMFLLLFVVRQTCWNTTTWTADTCRAQQSEIVKRRRCTNVQPELNNFFFITNRCRFPSIEVPLTKRRRMVSWTDNIQPNSVCILRW